MKVNGVENTTYNNAAGVANSNGGAKHYNNTPTAGVSSTPSFRGIDPTTCMIDFWAAVARGGLAASFTVQDMTGTNFPRTIAALDRNKDITGKNNYKAAVEVAIREFTTGPSMFIIPALVLAGASNMAGEANRVPVANITDFSEVMKGTMSDLHKNQFRNVNFKKMTNEQANKACFEIKKAFYGDVFKSIFASHGIDEGKINIDEYVRLMMKAEDPNTPSRNFFMNMLNKKVKVLGREVDSKDEVLSQIAAKFVEDKKVHGKGWGDFLTAKVLPTSKGTGINDLMDDLKHYSNNFAKSYITSKRADIPLDKRIISSKFIDNFRDFHCGSRFLTSAMMVIATGLFMCFIPKLYTRNKTNPETDAIYAQVNQQRKGAVNADK